MSFQSNTGGSCVQPNWRTNVPKHHSSLPLQEIENRWMGWVHPHSVQADSKQASFSRWKDFGKAKVQQRPVCQELLWQYTPRALACYVQRKWTPVEQLGRGWEEKQTMTATIEPWEPCVVAASLDRCEFMSLFTILSFAAMVNCSCSRFDAYRRLTCPHLALLNLELALPRDFLWPIKCEQKCCMSLLSMSIKVKCMILHSLFLDQQNSRQRTILSPQSWSEGDVGKSYSWSITKIVHKHQIHFCW